MMNIFRFFILAVLMTSLQVNAQVAVNTDGSAPDNSAMLDVKSFSKGLLVPRMTQAQRLAIPNPALGLLVFQGDGVIGLYSNNGLPSSPLWTMVGAGSGQWISNGSNLYYTSGNVGIGTVSPYSLLEVNGDSKFNGILVGRGGGNLLGNTAIGQAALQNNTTGSYNVAGGYYALYNNISGYSNTANGLNALYGNTAGYHNTAIGSHALITNNTGNYNTAVGSQALYDNTYGGKNSALGCSALTNNTYGNHNTAVGYFSLHFNTTGSSNVALGGYALYNSVTGNNNVAVGDSALLNNTVFGNTALGSKSLYANTLGTENTAVGYYSLYSNTSGMGNTAVGNSALYSNNNGGSNTSMGESSLATNSSGSGNTAIGYHSLQNNTSGSSNTGMGKYVLYYDQTTINNTAIGVSAGDWYINGNNNTFIGNNCSALSANLTNATGLGYNADIDASNKVRIGNTGVTSIGGQVGWTTFSDGRYKRNVEENIPGLAFISKLRPISYTVDITGLNDHYPKPLMREGQEAPEQPEASEQENIRYSGFVAQDVEKAAQEVGYDFSGIDKPQKDGNLYGLRYGDFVVPLVKAVQELNETNQAQKDLIEELLNRVDQLNKRVQELEGK